MVFCFEIEYVMRGQLLQCRMGREMGTQMACLVGDAGLGRNGRFRLRGNFRGKMAYFGS